MHFKSKPTHGKSCAQREGQARIIQQLVRDHALDASPRRRHVIVMGDFNDFDASMHYSGQRDGGGGGGGGATDASGNRPTSNVLAGFHELGLRNVLEKLPQHERWTWRADGRFPDSALDHAFIDGDLWGMVDAVWIDRNMSSLAASDHLPLVFRLNLENSYSQTKTQIEHDTGHAAANKYGL